MNLIKARRLIRCDFPELLTFISVTKSSHGSLKTEDLLRYLEHGKIYGIFKNATLSAALFIGNMGQGFMADCFFEHLASTGTQISYIRVRDDFNSFYIPQIIEFWEKEKGEAEAFAMIHYRYIYDSAPLLNTAELEIVALRAGIGIKPCLIFHSKKSATLTRCYSQYALCSAEDTKKLSHMLDDGYRGIGAVGSNLILCKTQKG